MSDSHFAAGSTFHVAPAGPPEPPAPAAPIQDLSGPAIVTAEEMVKAMSDPRYKSDAAYRNAIEVRIHAGMGDTGGPNAGSYSAGGWTPEGDYQPIVGNGNYGPRDDIGPVSGIDWSLEGLAPIEPFASAEEMAAAFRNPRMETDENYRNLVSLVVSKTRDYGYSTAQAPHADPVAEAIAHSLGVGPFRTAAEQQAAFNDPRYSRDAVYRDQVAARLKITPDFL